MALEKQRQAEIHRTSKETDITVSVHLDGSGKSNIDTGIGFFDHMLTHLAKYAFIDLDVKATGDLYIDAHHTVEDVAIVLGDAIDQAFGQKLQINRYGSATVPMDETLMTCGIDLSGRPILAYNVAFTSEFLGTMASELVEEFFKTLTTRMKMNCHLLLHYGKNNHHIAEAMFKAFGKALDEAKTIDERIQGVHSTKGLFD